MAWRPGLPEILIVLFIILLLFGPGRIASIAKELGSSITAFRQGMESDKKEPTDEGTSQSEENR